MTASPTWVLRPAASPSLPAADDDQAAAAAPSEGVRVVLGGPGTGKSTTLVEAVVTRLRQGTSLDRFVVLAASRQGAQELRRHIIWQRGGAEVGARITTIHGFALGLLREFGDPEQDLRLLRAPEQEQRLRDLLEGEGPDAWPTPVQAAAGTRAFARQLRAVLARARQLGLDPEQVIELAGSDDIFAAVGRFFELYLTIADFDGALDYTELVHRARLLLTDQAVVDAFLSRFDEIFVDDAQELDQAGVGLLEDLALLGVPLMAFGDPQQRLGAFRGASGGSLRRLAQLPGAETRTLRQGYRNQTAVAEALSHLRQRLDAKDAPPHPWTGPGDRSRVSVAIYDDAGAELSHLADNLRAAVLEDGCAWSELAVITRSGRSQLTRLARELTARGIPVEVAGDELALGTQRAVQVLLSGLAGAVNLDRLEEPQAAQLLASPLGGLDAVDQRKLARLLGGAGQRRLEECLAAPQVLESLASPEAEVAAALSRLLSMAAAQLSGGARVAEVLWTLWDGTAWPQRLRDAALAGSRSAHQDLDAVVELFELAERRRDLAGMAGAHAFSVEVAREEIPADTGRELSLQNRGVRLATAHRARSGVWRRVYMIGVSEGTWPQTTWRGLLLDPDRLAPDHLDAATTVGTLAAERRSFYVACSRAEEELHVSAPAATEEEPAEPSRFCRELGVDPVRITGSSPRRQTGPALVADLRRVVEDRSEAPAARRAAALRLARLAAVTGPQGQPVFREADPDNWWGGRTALPTWQQGEPIIITGSNLKALLACPRHWFMTRRGGAERPRGTQAGIGEVTHLIAQRAARDGLGLEEMLASLDEVWGEVNFETRSLRVTERDQVAAALARFHAWHVANPNQLIGVELDFELPLRIRGAAVVLRGTVDRLEIHDGRLAVVDLKTGRRCATKPELAEHEQLGCYQLAARLGAFEQYVPGVRDVAEPSLLQLRHGGALPVQQFQPLLAEGRNWLDEKLEQAVEVLTSGLFEAREGPQCAWCPVIDSCPVKQPEGFLV
ncbi:MAG: ATP-dependent DNA helicase [Propionibacteriaceae bacterium]|nr:ATP-dependent DNA helicase [Propionibacteriaceae bacterium]